MARAIDPDPCRRAALPWKNAFAGRTGASFHVVTRLCFDAAPVIAWDKRVQAEGDRPPVLATLKALIGHARACDVGPSVRFPTRQARNAARGLRPRPPGDLPGCDWLSRPRRWRRPCG